MALSPESDFLRALYQDWSDRMEADPNMSIPMARSLFDEWQKPTLEPEDVTYKSATIAGVGVLWAYPVGANINKVLLFTHGGGFVVGSSSSHRKMAAHIAKALGVTTVILDFRLAPEHPFPAQIEDSTAVYKELLKRGYAPENISTIGDSAGGNLAVSAVLKLREENVPLPGSVISISPWTDMERKGKTFAINAANDALRVSAILDAMTHLFLGEKGSPVNPLANLLYADFKGFPRLYVNAGSFECLLDDAVRLHERALAAGVDSTLSVVEGMQHVFPILAGRAPEADEEIQRIAHWYKS